MMRKITTTLCSMLVAAVLLLTGSYAWSAEYAVATSSNNLYLMEAGGSSTQFNVNWNTTQTEPLYTPSNLAGIGSHRNLLFIVDNSGTNPLLHVLRIDNIVTPRATCIKTIELKQGSAYLESPTSLSVDANGGVYVMGASNYAYVAPVEGSYSVDVRSIDSSNNYLLKDIAAFSNGPISNAIIAEKHLPSIGRSYATTVSGASVLSSPIEQTTSDYNPQAIAIHQTGTLPLAYILNQTVNDNLSSAATISVVNAANSASMGSFALPTGMKLLDIAAFTAGAENYIGVIAINDSGAPNSQILWKIKLGLDGLPDIGSRISYSLPSTSYSTAHQLAMSTTGDAFWITNKFAGTVDVLNADSWGLLSPGSHIVLGDNAHYITAWDGNINSVPEPSSMIAFLSFAAGMLGFVRRRTR